MTPITSVRMFQRAKRDLEMIDGQLADLKTRREAAIAGFDQAESLLRAQRGDVANAMQAWQLQTETKSTEPAL